jgi:hypothetical protein
MAQRLATHRQIDYLLALVSQVVHAEQTLDPENGPELAAALAEGYADLAERDDFTATHASKAIDSLKVRLSILKAKTAIANPPAPTTEPGFYVHDDNVYVVVYNKAKTNVYAKRMNLATGRWEYAAGAVKGLTERLTVEQAAALGHLHGRCVCCGAELSDPESVTRGIGPVCAKRL